MKSTKNDKPNIKKGFKPTKSESFDIENDLVMYLYDAGDNRDKYVRVDFNDYYNHDNFCMIVDVKKLKRMADFIYKYLETNND